jgi:hypothetical protein
MTREERNLDCVLKILILCKIWEKKMLYALYYCVLIYYATNHVYIADLFTSISHLPNITFSETRRERNLDFGSPL